LAPLDRTKADMVRISRGQSADDVVTVYRPAPGEWWVTTPGMRHRADLAAVMGDSDERFPKDDFHKMLNKGKGGKGDTGLLAAVEGKGQVKEFFDVKDEAKEGKALDEKLGFTTPTAKVEVWLGGLEPEKKEEKKSDKKDEKDKKDKKGAKDKK